MTRLFKRHHVTAFMYLPIVCLLLGITAATNANAIPRFSLLTGTRCSACHFNPQGSGIRTQLGWEMMNETGLFKWHNTENDTSSVMATNTLFSKKLFVGGDARAQEVRVSSTGERLFIPMQLAASLAYQASHTVTAYTDINLASIEERVRTGGLVYPGEADFDAAIQYHPYNSPSFRIGMIEPYVGMRQDDHTVFVRREAALQNIAIFPAYYNEVGADVTFEQLRWLTINAGVYNAKNLAAVDPSIGDVKNNFDFAHPSYNARVVLWPQLLDEGINGEVGGSIFGNGAFRMLNGFVGFGLADKATLYFEAMYSKNADQRIIRNFTFIGTYQLMPWLSAEYRYDWGQTELYPMKNFGYADALTVGFEFFPLPYIEIRPEYRLFQQTPITGTGTYTGQYTAQLHLFY